MGRIKTNGSSGHLFEGCRFHKPRHVFDTMCNACLVRSLQVMDERLKVLEEEKMSAQDEWERFFEDLPYGTFCKVCDEIDRLRAENERLVTFNYRLMEELAQHGWGDFHLSSGMHQDSAIVALLKEGKFGDYADSDTEAPSTDVTPPTRGNIKPGEWEDTMGRRGSGEVPDGFGVLPPIRESG